MLVMMKSVGKAPGKIIVSGEHAVVYQCPAIVMSTNHYAICRITQTPSKQIRFSFPQLKRQKELTMGFFEKFPSLMKREYRRFTDGKIPITNVLPDSFDLIPFAAALTAPDADKLQGVELTIESNIPLGCGMGSSAAISLAVIRAIRDHLGLTLSQDDEFELALDCEKLQHGHPSGVDPYVCQHGGCHFIHKDRKESMEKIPFPFTIINSGKPDSSTGECVEAVRKSIGQDSSLWQEFENVTYSIRNAIMTNDRDELKIGFIKNQKLLKQIGVVPEKVQAFIDKLYDVDIVAKTSGAGSVTGDNGGCIICLDDHNIPPELLKEFAYESLTENGSTND
ncbi:hypothetical protein JYT61_00630 [bacterium AH-315-E10]|nr:hypothetical protein [bacterium AH-315-E10]